MFEKILAKRGLSVERLLALVETKEAGTIAKAAPDDPVRQGQYSRQIKELEEFFGFTLGERKGRRLELTQAGKELAELGKGFLLGLQDYQSRQRGEATTVTIGAYESVAQWILLPRLPDLHRHFPQVQWALDSGRTAEIVRGLSELRLDLGFVRQNAVKKPLRFTGGLRLSYCLFAPKAKVPKDRQADAKWVAENLPVVLPHGQGEFRDALEQGAAHDGVKLRMTLTCQTAVQACAAVATGEFCGFLPAAAGSELPSSHFLQMETSWLKDYSRSLCLAWNPRLFKMRPHLATYSNYLAKLVKA